jgi:hypothetical protein
VGIVDLDLLVQNPQKDATIISRRKGRGSKLKRMNNGGKNMLKNPRKPLGRIPFYRRTKYDCLGAK